LSGVLEALLAYSLRLTPGLVALGATFALWPRRQVIARILLLILGFVLVRDVMTPLGFWSFGRTGVAFWIRFRPDAPLLRALALASAGLAAAIWIGLPDLRAGVRRPPLTRASTWLWGLGGVLVISLPVAALAQTQPLSARGGAVPVQVLPALFALAILGNLLEELLFRGLLQSQLEPTVGPRRAVLLSGLTFAAGHVFLASTVTDVGAPLLLFTLAEGLVAAEVYRRAGLWAATLTHGGIIFLLASGLY